MPPHGSMKAPAKPKDMKGTFKRLVSLMKDAKYKLLMVLGCIVVTTGISSFGIYLLQPVLKMLEGLAAEYNQTGVWPAMDGLIGLLSLMAGMYLISIVCQYAQNRIMMMVSTGVLNRVRKQMFDHMEDLPIRYFDQHTHGEIMSRYTNDTDTLREFFSSTFPQAASSFLSICFALIATAICLLIGYPLAFFISQLKPSTQKILIVLIMLPMWISLLIRTYSLMAILDNGGLLNSLLEMLGLPKAKIVGTSGAVILGMVYDFLPYMVLPIYTSISKIDKRYLEAAQDLGCNNVRTLFKVVFPLSVPGVISGITMVFVPSISTFYISQKLGGGSFDLIGDTIERQFQNVSTYNIGAAISLIMMILILISVAVMNKFSDDEEGGIIV